MISPLLEKAGLLAPNFVLIDHGSTGLVSMAPAFGRFSAAELFDTFVFPYAGTIILALALFKLAGEPLKILWVAPLIFLGLAAAHYLAGLGYCQGCMTTYTPYFAAFGACGRPGAGDDRPPHAAERDAGGTHDHGRGPHGRGAERLRAAGGLARRG